MALTIKTLTRRIYKILYQNTSAT